MSNNVENLSPQIIRGVAREMQDLVNNPPEGIKVQINEEDVTDIQAFIEGPAGKSLTHNLHSDLQCIHVLCIFVQNIGSNTHFVFLIMLYAS